MTQKIAIVVVAYNRVTTLSRLLKSLESAVYDESVTLIISIDKSETDKVESYADSYCWRHGDKVVAKHEKNMGLRAHMLSLDKYFEEFDALIILEDDITVVPSFYYYSKACVRKFFDDTNIAGISLYSFSINYLNAQPFMPLQSDSDVYLMQCAQSWGQIWMRKQWFEFKTWYEKNSEDFLVLPHLPLTICSWPKSSWLKYHTRYVIENDKYFVYPYISYSTNNGDAGTHVSVAESKYQANLLYGLKNTFNLNPTIVYDGFFENVNLPLPVDDVCVDFYGQKENRMKNRYWLSSDVLDYEIINSYALEMRPYEWNIINNREGKDLFLYDTKLIKKNKLSKSYVRKYYYLYRIGFDNLFLIKRLIKNIIGRR